MKKRTELMEKINKLNTSEITIDTYVGFSYLHVDLAYNGKQVLWCAASCSEEIKDNEQLEMKISDINDIVFRYDSEAKSIIEKLIEICREIGISKIYGRVTINNTFEETEKFYKDLGFNVVHTPNDKKYDSAKIELIF